MVQAGSLRTALAVVVLGGVALRLALGVWLYGGDEGLRLPDEREYVQIATNLLSGKGLVLLDPRFADATEPGVPLHAARLPGYPWFVAACGGNVVVVRIVQAVLDGTTALAAAGIARRRLGATGAVVAAGLVAVNPFMAYFSQLVLSETLFAAMLTLGLAGVLTERRGWRVPGLAVIAASVLVRPSGLLLAGAVGWSAGWASSRDDRAASGFRGLLLGLAMTVVFLLPWAVRSRLHPSVGEWVWTTTNAGFVQYDGFNPRATGASDQWFAAELSELRGMGEVERSRYLSGLASRWIVNHPWDAAMLAGAKVARTWSPVPLSREYGTRLHQAAGLAFALPLMVLAAVGLVGTGLPWQTRLVLATPAVYFTLIHAASVGSLRYRVPVEPALAVLAASAAAGVAARWFGGGSAASDVAGVDVAVTD